MEDFNPDDEPKEPKREEEEEGDLVGHEKFKFIVTQLLDSSPLNLYSHHILYRNLILASSLLITSLFCFTPMKSTK